MCICWEKCLPIVFLIIPFANRIISGAEHKCTNVPLDLKWMVPAGEGNHPPQLNFLPWKCIQSCKSHIYLPGLITSNAFAMCLQYIQGDVSDYHSSLSNYKTHQSKANRSWDIWHLREEQAAGLPPVPGGATESRWLQSLGVVNPDFLGCCSSCSFCMLLTSHPCCVLGTPKGYRLLLPSVLLSSAVSTSDMSCTG